MKPSRRHLVLSIAIGVVTGAVLATATLTGLTAAIGTAVVPATTSSDPVVLSSWSGYGVGTTSANAPIIDILGSFVVPNVTCPQPNASANNPYGVASEAIAVGLDHYGGVAALKLDGAGVVVVCVLGSPVYRAWVQQAPFPAFLLPVVVKPGDSILVNVTLSGWTFTDLTTAGGAAGSWTGSLSIAKAHNTAECVVSRVTALGILPAIFKQLPATVPTALTNPVEFGSAFVVPTPGAASAGCWYTSPSATGAPGAWLGIGNDPSPPFVAFQFDLANPNAATEITPGPLATGVLLDDSFVVP